MMEMEIGHRLRLVRMRAQLSQRQLSEKTGVTNSTISLIESGRTNPSVGALKRILDGIPIGLSEFFALESAPAPSPFYAAEDLVEIGKGKISFRQVGQDMTGSTLQILKERYAPGADTGRVPLVHDGEEGGVIISGRLEVTVGDERRVLGPGDAYRFSSRRPHRFRAVGHAPVEVISACTPPTF